MTFRPCIVVPVFNHADGATKLAERISEFGLKTIMVNDGSSAECSASLRLLAERHDWIQVIEHEENQGKGGAVLSGLRAAYETGHSHALQIDADGQHDANDIPRFLSLAAENPNAVVVGQPQFDQSMPLARRIARYLTHVWIWVETLSFVIRDSMCGFRVYPLKPVIALADSTPLGRRMDFDPEILVRLWWEGLLIHSLTTRVVYPPDGQSHFRMWHDNWLISCMHVRLVFGMLWRLPRLVRRKYQRQSVGTGHGAKIS